MGQHFAVNDAKRGELRQEPSLPRLKAKSAIALKNVQQRWVLNEVCRKHQTKALRTCQRIFWYRPQMELATLYISKRALMEPTRI
jgi:hypothetical protein